MQPYLLFICSCFAFPVFAQSPLEAPLPERFGGMEAALLVHHFPATVYATTDSDRKDFLYFWKHNTAVLSPSEEVVVLECGAYLFYESRWNLRISYPPKKFSRLFDCPGARLKPGQPYTFTDNWRTDNRLSGGWAMWYVIGQNEAGKKVYGVGRIETVGELQRH